MKSVSLPIQLLGAAVFVVGSASLFPFVADQFAHPERLWANWLVASLYVLCLGLGAAVLLALFTVTGARWSDDLRPALEKMTALLPAGALGVAIVLLAYPLLYPWVVKAPSEPRSPFQEFWLQRPFFLLRALLYLAAWLGMTLVLVRASRRGADQGPKATRGRPVAFSALYLVVFALTFWLASTDWIMSLEPKWSSTIFGVYNFSGLLIAALAALLVVAVIDGRLERAQLRDLSTLLFGFSSFWMYIWFSQYMLIWYVNNPEETEYFVLRQFDPWQPLFFANLLLNWGIPFAVLLFRQAKANRIILPLVAVSVLLGRWVDLALMVLPPVARAGPIIELGDVILVPGMVGLAVLILLFRPKSADPRALAT